MEGLFSIAKSTASLTSKTDDDSTDRVNHLWTALVLLLFAVVVSSGSYVGKPLTCWIPGDISGHGDYITDICWISNTYWLPWDEEIPDYPGQQIIMKSREDREITYYQWVPFILLLQALMFYVPRLFWRSLNDKSGVNLVEIMSAATKAENVNPTSRADSINVLSRHIDLCLDKQMRKKDMKCGSLIAYCCCLCFGRRHGNFLYPLYLCTKVLYCGNVIGQIFLLNRFLGSTYELFGLRVLENAAASHHSWRLTGVFPRVTMCDFLIRVLGNLHRHTVQCVLPINMFNEKIYIFIWFWFFFLSIFTVLSLLAWLKRMTLPMSREAFISTILKRLGVYKPDNPEDRKIFHSFMKHYLKVDGVFILRLVKGNAGDLVINDILKTLWVNYKKRGVAVDSMFLEEKRKNKLVEDDTRKPRKDRTIEGQDDEKRAILS